MLERMQGSRINDQRCHMPAYAQVTMAMLSILFITIETCIYIAKTLLLLLLQTLCLLNMKRKYDFIPKRMFLLLRQLDASCILAWLLNCFLQKLDILQF